MNNVEEPTVNVSANINLHHYTNFERMLKKLVVLQVMMTPIGQIK